MPEETTFLHRQTARDLAARAVESLTIPAVDGDDGTYQSPTRGRLRAAVAQALGGQGLTRASHLIELLDAVERVRARVSVTAENGTWEPPELNLRRRAAALLPRPQALVRPATAREVLELINLATFS